MYIGQWKDKEHWSAERDTTHSILVIQVKKKSHTEKNIEIHLVWPTEVCGHFPSPLWLLIGVLAKFHA